MWIDFMKEALDGLSHHAMEQPPGIVDVRINPESGLVAATNQGSVFEKFRIDHVPEREQDRTEWQPEIFSGGRERVDGQGQEPLF
jgi:penicillin-binding protein 1A